MKKYLFLLSFFFSVTIYAQIEQRGIVLEINSKKHPVKDVQIWVNKSQPNYSDDNGLFSFVISEASDGDRISVDSIKKPDYVVINREEINRWSITNDNYPWPHLVEVAHKDSLKIWKDQYLNQADFFSRRELEKQVASLKIKLEKGEQSEEEYRNQKEKIEEENRNLQIQLNDLAERFAYINRDFALPAVSEALDAYRIGDVQKATSLLHNIDIAKEIEISEHNLRVAQKEFYQASENKRQWIQAAMVLGRFYSSKINLDSANYYFETAAIHDSLNYNNNAEYAAFLQHRMLNYKKSLHFYSIALPLAYDNFNTASIENKIGAIKNQLGYPFEEVSSHYLKALGTLVTKDTIDMNEARLDASIFSNVAELQKDVCHFKEAEENFLLGVHSMQKIVKWTNADSDKQQLAQILTTLGDVQITLGKFQTAEKNLIDAIKFYQSIDPVDTLSFNIEIIRTYYTIGKLFLRQDNSTSAETYINEALRRSEACLKSDSLMFLPVFAESLDLMGQCITKLNIPDKAEEYFRESLSVFERLVLLSPETYQSKFAHVLMNFGIFLCQLNQYKSAEEYLKKSVEISRELAQNKPEVYAVDLTDGLNEIAELFIQTSQYQNAESSYWESLFMCYTMKYYQSFNFYSEVIKTYQSLIKLAILNENTEEAKLYLNEALFYCNIAIDSGMTKYINEKERMEKELAQLKKAKKKSTPAISDNSENLITSNSYGSVDYSNWLGSISYFLILEQNYGAAEYLAKKALIQYPNQFWIKTNLALSLLLQGKFEEAQKIYIKLKDQSYPLEPNKTFNDIFIQDLDEIELKGFKHPDIIRVRILLANY